MASTNPFASIVPPEIGPLELKKLGDDSFNSKEYKKAIYCYTKALEFQPNNPILYANRSVCWGELGQLNRALIDADAAIRANPMYAKGHTRRGAALFAMKRYKDAVLSLQSSLNIDPKDELTKKAFDIAKEKAEKCPEEDQSSKFEGKKENHFTPRYKHLKEINDTIYENIVDRAFIPAYLPYRESLDDWLFHMTTEERRKILEASRDSNKNSPSLAPEVIPAAHQVLHDLMASPEQLLNYLDSIAFFSLERRNGGKTIVDMSLVGPQEASENPELMQKWLIYLAVETEFMKQVKKIDKSKITHQPSVLSGELLTQMAMFIGEVSNQWISLQEKESSHKDKVKIVSLLDQEALASSWKLVDLEAEYFVGYLKELNPKDVDQSAFDIIQSVARDRKQAGVLLTKPTSEVFVAALKNEEFKNRISIAAVLASHLNPEHEANRLVVKQPIDKDIYNYLLDQLLSKSITSKGKAYHEAQAKYILEKKDVTLLRALANFVLGSKRIAVDLSNRTNLLEITYHALSIQLDQINSITNKSKNIVLDDISVKVFTQLLRILAGFINVRALNEKINSIGTAAVLHGIEVCAEPHLRNLGSQIYSSLTNPPKGDEIEDEEELTQEVESALNQMNISTDDVLDEEFPEPKKIAELRKQLIKASDVWMDFTIMKNDVRYISACNGEGTVYLCGYNEVKGRKNKQHVFMGILYNVILKKIDDAVLFEFDTYKEAEEYWVKKYSMLQKFWVRISTEAAALLTYSMKDTYPKEKMNDEAKEVFDLLLAIGGGNIPKRTLEEAYLDCIADKAEAHDASLDKPYYWWREFVGARFISEFQFGVGDMLDVGCGPVPKHLTFVPRTIYDVPPKPDNFLCYWIRQCAKNISYDPVHFVDRVNALLLHMTLYFQGNLQTEETQKINMKNVVYNVYLLNKKVFQENEQDPIANPLTKSPILCAMIERTAYYSKSNEIPIEGMASVFEQFHSNLEFPFEGMLRSINAMLPIYEHFTEDQTNKIRDQLLQKVRTLYQKDKKASPEIEVLSEIVRTTCTEVIQGISGKHLTLVTGYMSEMMTEFLSKVWLKVNDKSFDPMPISHRRFL
ncbi:hypothetical protein H8356DRAFT_1645065 [Neocallimastix lanati (nom. inval.)]|jgi:tetratricopeptide (TPR) repeat protein|nr:hypothetical protein H8356DRAFT_1645065 [Neocallimastix sp. JGI-2020a]